MNCVIFLDGDGRTEWFRRLERCAEAHNFLFLDPDNGLEVRSRPHGRPNSSKYLFWHEVKSLWTSGKSLLIYQHFVHAKRPAFIHRRLQELQDATPNSVVEAFSTSHVVFLMALQPEHSHSHATIVEESTTTLVGAN